MSNLQALYQKKGEVIHQMKDLYAQAEKEGRGLNADEESNWAKMEEGLSTLQARIDKGEEVRKLLSGHEVEVSSLSDEVAETRAAFSTTDTLPETEKKPEITYRSAWNKWGSLGPASLTQEERRIMGQGHVKGTELRGTLTQISSTANLGGYLSPEEWANQVVESMKVFGGMLEAGQIYRTKGGDVFHIPTEDTTTQVGAIIGQGVGDTVADVTWGEKTMGAFTYTSNIIKIAEELYAEDDTFDVLGRVANIAAKRVGRITNQHFTTGAGTTEPFGAVTEATAGVTAAANTGVTRTEILDLIHSPDPAYRVGPKVGLMFNDSTLAAIRKLSIGSADDRPLWVPSMREGAPDTIEGQRYFINQDMADIGASAVSMIYGDFSNYWIRQVRGMKLSRSDQRYWEERAVAYFLTARFDGKLVDTAAIKKLTHPA